jgi:UDP-glucose 4,6-dehydratase
MTSELLSKKWNEQILILGKGYIGYYLYNSLSEHQRIIVSSEDLNYHDISTLNKFLLNKNISLVINCSGFTGRPNVDEGELKKEKCWELNVVSPLKINRLCNKLDIRYIHISSGCIYNGYDKEFVEDDKPNFGLFDYSSFYSKSKHAFELMSSNLDNKIVRIRMPITPDTNPRNFLTKIKNYDNIISMVNSKTYIPDLCNFLKNLIDIDKVGFWGGQDIYNVVNPNPLSTHIMASFMIGANYHNENWNYVDLKDLDIIAPRSNCVLNGDKANKIYQMREEEVILKDALTQITKLNIQNL